MGGGGTPRIDTDEISRTIADVIGKDFYNKCQMRHTWDFRALETDTFPLSANVT